MVGVKNATSGQLMDSMYSSWNLDPVHGEKVAYRRIGLSLLDIIRKDPPREQRDSLCPKKRSREDDSPPGRSKKRGGEGPLRSRKKQLQEGGLLCQQAGSLRLYRLSRRL